VLQVGYFQIFHTVNLLVQLDAVQFVHNLLVQLDPVQFVHNLLVQLDPVQFVHNWTQYSLSTISGTFVTNNLQYTQRRQQIRRMRLLRGRPWKTKVTNDFS